MAIETTYKAKILDEILREFLQDGTIPTADILIEAYEARAYSDMSIPILSHQVAAGTHLVEEKSDSSAIAYNAFFEQAKTDLEVLYTEIWDRMLDGMTSFDEWRIVLEGLRKDLIDLERRIDSLLLLRQDTAGYFAFVEENLIDLSKIDQPNTTATIDIVNHMVSAGVSVATSSKISPESIPTKGATFTVLTRESLVSAKDAPGTQLNQAISDLSEYWQHRVQATRGDQLMNGELKIRLSDDELVDISRISIRLHSSDNNSSVSIIGQYSTDNYNWYNLPTENYTQSVDRQAVFQLEELLSTKWVKFIMTKVGPDDISEEGFYIYEFGAESIDFYPMQFNTETDSVLQSQELSAYDSENTRIAFDKIALEACQTTPEGTSIKYSISVSNSSEEWTPELPIDPYNIANPDFATQINLGRLTETTVEDLYKVKKDEAGDSPDSATFFSQYYNSPQIDRLALLGTTTTTAYKITASQAQNIITDSIVLYRNIGPTYGTTDLVREAPRGWRYDETSTYLMTTIVIQNPAGILIDFGSAGAELDGILVTGSTAITQGTHLFKTHIRNTGSITSTYSTEEDMKLNDPAAEGYGYNHQKLIEGYNYPSDFVGSQYYLGVDVYCEHAITKRNKVSIFDFINNVASSDYSRYAMDSFTSSGQVYEAFVIRFDPEDTNHANERFSLVFSTGSSMFDRVILKAELSSDDTNKTPVLTAYRLKLGA